MQTLCWGCGYNGGEENECMAPDAPYTDCVRGIKSRLTLNLNGECQWFRWSQKKEGE
jgi:hypothetical protein